MTTEYFFQLLRYAIGASDELPANLSREEWEDVYKIAQRQSLLGVLFYGLQRCPSLKPERNVLLQWYVTSERIRKTNEKENCAAVKVTKAFREKGFRTCILKGQGNTLNYPDPFIRTSGDIDLWVEGGDKKVLAFVRQYVQGTKACYHHVDFRDVDGVGVEVHYRPTFMTNPIHNRRMQRWFQEQSDAQFSHEVSLPNAEGTVCVPTHAFNRIYQLTHIFHHVIDWGVGLRQLVDYYYVLKQGFTEEERVADVRLLKHFGLDRIASAVMWVLHEHLGLEEELLLVAPDEQLGRFLIEEIMLSGNFGHFDPRVKHDASQLERNIQRLKRDLRLVGYFPSECLWEPAFRLFNFLWRQVKEK